MEELKCKGVSENPNDHMKKMNDVLQYWTTKDLEALYDNGMDIDQTDFEGRTGLMMMTVKGKKDAVNMIIRRGANINFVFMYQGRLPKTALDAANECKKVEITEILLKHGAKTWREVELEAKSNNEKSSITEILTNNNPKTESNQ